LLLFFINFRKNIFIDSSEKIPASCLLFLTLVYTIRFFCRSRWKTNLYT